MCVGVRGGGEGEALSLAAGVWGGMDAMIREMKTVEA